MPLNIQLGFLVASVASLQHAYGYTIDIKFFSRDNQL